MVVTPQRHKTPGPFLTELVLVAVGGLIGTGVRYGLVSWFSTGRGFPTTTLVINVSGAFFLGLLLAGIEKHRSPRVLRVLIGVGVLGGFTTFSSMSNQIVTLMRDGRSVVAVTYGALTLVLGLILAALGLIVGHRSLQEIPLPLEGEE